MSPMTFPQQVITIALCVLGTVATRFLPFLVFAGKRKTPAIVQYLGKALPSAIFAMLVVYCLKDITFTDASGWLPSAISVAAVVLLHIFKRNTLLSIVGGTLCYMLLIRLIH